MKGPERGRRTEVQTTAEPLRQDGRCERTVRFALLDHAVNPFPNSWRAVGPPDAARAKSAGAELRPAIYPSNDAVGCEILSRSPGGSLTGRNCTGQRSSVCSVCSAGPVSRPRYT